MKQNDKDILAGRTDLKEMPYSVPERYFEDFRSQMKPTSAKENSLYMRLAPYMAMAAMFILLVTGGTFLLRHATPEEVAGAKATKCDNIYLITDHESEIIEEDGYTIQVVPIWEWLTR